MLGANSPLLFPNTYTHIQFNLLTEGEKEEEDTILYAGERLICCWNQLYTKASSSSLFCSNSSLYIYTKQTVKIIRTRNKLSRQINITQKTCEPTCWHRRSNEDLSALHNKALVIVNFLLTTSDLFMSYTKNIFRLVLTAETTQNY